jgi:hypothetical protein
VQFTSLGAGATAWAWDFGDGERSAEANPLHTYAADGEYSVSLVAGVAAAKPVVIETPPPVDCVLSDWSEWSDWTPVAGSPAREERTRTRSVVVEPANGGKACDPRSEREERDVVIPPPPPPSWIPAAGECKAIRQNAAGEPVKTLMQVGPYYPTNGAGVSYKGIVGTAAVVGAWGSATLCTGWGTRGALAACNGGDGDYWGNEVYVFDFDTRDWERISDPNILVAQSDPDYVAAKAANPSLHVVVFSRDLPVDDPRHWNPAECEHGPMVPGAYTRVPGSSPSQYLPSANPVGAGPLPLGTAPGSPHNYDGICYLPGSVFGNERGAEIFPHLTYVYGTSSNSRAYAFDLDTRRWHRFTHNVSPGWAPGAGGRLQRCGVDLEAGRIYHSYGYTDLATRMQVSRQWAMNQSMPIESKMHFDTTRRIWIGANTTQGDGGKTEPGALIATSPDSGLGYVTLNMQGELWPRGYGKDAGLAYVPELDAYYLYNCLGSNDTIRPLVGADVLYKIQPPASDPLTAPWVVSIERMAGEIPERTPLTIGKTIGNMGRFCWNPAIKSLVTLNSASGFVYLYKPQGLQ